MEYKNRHGDTFHFSYNEDGNIDWKGEFRYTRCGFDIVGDREVLFYVDPSGGPFIGVDTDMSRFGLEGIATGVVNRGEYYEILIKKE